MDEIEMLSSLRPDPAPTAEIVANNKERLRTTIKASGNGHSARRTTITAAAASADIATDPAQEHEDIEVFDLTLGRSVEAPARPRRGRFLAAAAAVMAVAGVATVMAVNNDSELGTADDPPAGLACGTELPFTFTAPEGFAGPEAGPLREDRFARLQPVDGQAVQHWTSPTGGIELRWPSQDAVTEQARLDDAADFTASEQFEGAEITDEGDVVATVPPPPGDRPTDEGHSVETTPFPRGADLGFLNIDVVDTDGNGSESTGFSGEIAAPELGEGLCGTVRLTVMADSGEAAVDLFESSRTALLAAFAALPDAGGPDVEGGAGEESAVEREADELTVLTESVAVAADSGGPALPQIVVQDTLPPVDGCEEPTSPNVGGDVDGQGDFPGPSQALDVFLETQPTLLQDGYLAHLLPDGSVGFVVENPSARVVTAVHVVQTAGGWTVASWEASGC